MSELDVLLRAMERRVVAFPALAAAVLIGRRFIPHHGLSPKDIQRMKWAFFGIAVAVLAVIVVAMIALRQP